MAAVTMADVIRDQWLSGLPAMAASHGLYGDFVPYQMDGSDAYAGVYFVVSAEPFDPQKFDVKEYFRGAAAHLECHFDMKFGCFDICRSDSGDIQSTIAWQEAENYVIKRALLKGAFHRFGEGLEVPRFIPYSDAATLCACAQNIFRATDFATDFELGNCATTIKNYVAFLKSAQNKWKGILPNPDYYKWQYMQNQKLIWSKHWIVRAWRWLNRNNTSVSKAVMEKYAGGDTKKIYMADECTNPKTGEKYKGRKTMYAQFMREFRAQYPYIPIRVERGNTSYNGIITLKGPVSEYQVDIYTKSKAVVISDKDFYKAAQIWNRICLTSNPCNTFGSAHPIETAELEKLGQTDVRYIDGSDIVAGNLCRNLDQNHIPYALDRGEKYSARSDGYIPLVYLKANDPDINSFMQFTINSINKDFDMAPKPQEVQVSKKNVQHKSFDLFPIENPDAKGISDMAIENSLCEEFSCNAAKKSLSVSDSKSLEI